MRYFALLIVALFMALALISSQGPGPAYAAFHCMRIHAVGGTFGGSQHVQYVELRMDLGGQPLVGGHTLKFFDGAGVLKATFTFPGNVTNSALGDSVLVGTTEFNAKTNGGDGDFTFSATNTVAANGGDALHPVQRSGGLVHFAQGSDNCDGDVVAGPGEVDSVAYGSATSHFPPAATALPGDAGTTQALRLSNLNTVPSNNSTEYSLQPASATTFAVAAGNLATDLSFPRNNARTVLQLTATSVGGEIIEDGSGTGGTPLAESDGGRDIAVPAGAAGGALVLILAAGAAAYAWQRRRVDE